NRNRPCAFGTASPSRGCIVRLPSDGGHVGYASPNPPPHMGSTFETPPAELERFKPILLGKDPFAIELILRELDRSLTGASQAKAGIDCALHDLCARALGVPLYNLLGGKVRDSVPVLRHIAIKTPAHMP